MFKLQRLEITGFKSFADHTEIVFTGNGITAVVGPNGCGKSNVSDAMSWVLGEQRAKSLRGGEMKDVIFQGAKDRKNAGMAEVILHMVRDGDATDADEEELFDIDEALSELDEKAVDVDALEADGEVSDEAAAVAVEANGSGNGYHSEGEQPVEVGMAVAAGAVATAAAVGPVAKAKRHWRPRSMALDFAPGEAVSVTRRLYLSGESEYQLNGRNCRLRDIQDLFAGTGLSGAHYAIVEQGRIGQILSAKPSDRRNLIEEAAGISKFRTRQRAAESRLDSAKTNLSRISDIVSEIDKQANSLRRQAAKTRRFIALQEEFRGRLRELFAAEGRHYAASIDAIKGELEGATHREREASEKVAASEIEVRAKTELARAAEESLSEVRRRHADEALERDRAEREHRYRSEQVVALNARIDALNSENTAVDERLKLAEAEIERLKGDEAKQNEEDDASKLSLFEAEKVWGEKLEAVRGIEGKLEEVRRDLILHSSAVERFDELRRQLDINAGRLKERAEGLEKEKARAASSIKDHNAEADKLAGEIGKEKEKLEGFIREKDEVLNASAAAREALESAESDLRVLREEFSRKSHRFETLHELEETRAVYYPQVQQLFAKQDAVGASPVGVLADFLNVEESAERAVEAVFGSLLQAVLVRTPEDAAAVSRWAASNTVGRVSTLVVGDGDLSAATTPSDAGGDLGSRLGASAGTEKLLRRLFPKEMAAAFVQDLGDGTRGEGITVDAGGSVAVDSIFFTAGAEDPNGRNASLLAFKRELAGLSRSVQKLRQKIDASDAEVAKRRASLAEFEEKIVDIQSVIIKIERGLVALELQASTTAHEIDRAERHLAVVTSEIEQTAAESQTISTRMAEAESSGLSAESERLAVSAALEEISTELAAARRDAEAGSDAVNEKRTVAATVGERRRSMQFALRRLEAESDDLRSRRAGHDNEIGQTTARIEDLHTSIAQLAGAIAGAADAIATEQDELVQTLGRLEEARTVSDAAAASLADLNKAASEALNSRASVEIRKTELVTELRNLNEKCLHDLQMPLVQLTEEVPAPDDEFDIDEAKSIVEEQRTRLEAFGAINMLAVEELGEAEERLDFLTSQRQDIIDSIAAAEEALREIKIRSREKFRAAFEAVNANFTQFFRELFGGGIGEMTLLESEDILDAGIEISAQPPGKRLQNILLLSGGEKAMTAIALVLAIFKYRPSPFCLLDEVDAPLDDANVGRFVGKIAEMSEKTQFIVITHNKRTMEAARALYGVTMQEAGVSKIVSVKFE